MSIETLTHYRVTCDGYDDAQRCPQIIPEMAATALSGLYLDLHNRGWRVIAGGDVLCPAHAKKRWAS